MEHMDGSKFMTSNHLQSGLFEQKGKRDLGLELAKFTYRERLAYALSLDLGFHGQASNYLSHDFHAFPAKFPPQLPHLFIEALTTPEQTVLDPMMGSGTTILEACRMGRSAIGFDIDPLALLLCQTKVSSLTVETVLEHKYTVSKVASELVTEQKDALTRSITSRLDRKTQEFVDYWFSPETQLELEALRQAICSIPEEKTRSFFELSLSAIIITKSGGVSLARDLAHTRPHKDIEKSPRSALVEFQKRLDKNIRSLRELNQVIPDAQVRLQYANAQKMPLEDSSVDLIVTSPPYAANAIDYMRAHKFSLIWFGHKIEALSLLRKEYIGGEAVNEMEFVPMPAHPAAIIARIGKEDQKKSRVLHRYYSEMQRVLAEMYRVLKPDTAAIVVVGTSTMRGIDTETQNCLGDIGAEVGFEVVDIAVRQLDRDKRMMPARKNGHRATQIEERMHEEYVIGFYKPSTPLK
jgi:DNA modification methylase